MAQGRNSWLCARSYDKVTPCKVRLTTEGNMVVKILHEHTHLASVSHVVCKSFKEQLKKDALCSAMPPLKILTRRNWRPAKRSYLWIAWEKLDQNCPFDNRIRRGANPQNSYKTPTSTADIEIPTDLKSILINGNTERFLLLDTGSHCLPERLLLFGTIGALKILSKSPHWQADGTFRIAPDLFGQLYTLHAEYKGKTIPCIYGIVTNKTENSYKLFFNAVFMLAKVQLNVDLRPESILTDFEIAAINAILHCFPNTQINCCYFHLKQSVHRKIVDLRIKKLFDRDIFFSNKIKMMVALAFVPVDRVEEAFELIINSDDFPESTSAFAKYFKATYVGMDARYSHSIWNMYERTIKELPRTNNSVESWHNTLRYTIPQGNQCIYLFLESLKKQHQLGNFEVCQLDAGTLGRWEM